jgi:hypothetical protein
MAGPPTAGMLHRSSPKLQKVGCYLGQPCYVCRDSTVILSIKCRVMLEDFVFKWKGLQAWQVNTSCSSVMSLSVTPLALFNLHALNYADDFWHLSHFLACLLLYSTQQNVILQTPILRSHQHISQCTHYHIHIDLFSPWDPPLCTEISVIQSILSMAIMQFFGDQSLYRSITCYLVNAACDINNTRTILQYWHDWADWNSHRLQDHLYSQWITWGGWQIWLMAHLHLLICRILGESYLHVYHTCHTPRFSESEHKKSIYFSIKLKFPPIFHLHLPCLK